MAARAYWKGQVRLALVSIPVKIHPATRSGAAIRFQQTHEPRGKPLVRLGNLETCGGLLYRRPVKKLGEGQMHAAAGVRGKLVYKGNVGTGLDARTMADLAKRFVRRARRTTPLEIDHEAARHVH